jgi:hypothetical protein
MSYKDDTDTLSRIQNLFSLINSAPLHSCGTYSARCPQLDSGTMVTLANDLEALRERWRTHKIPPPDAPEPSPTKHAYTHTEAILFARNWMRQYYGSPLPKPEDGPDRYLENLGLLISFVCDLHPPIEI